MEGRRMRAVKRHAKFGAAITLAQNYSSSEFPQADSTNTRFVGSSLTYSLAS